MFLQAKRCCVLLGPLVWLAAVDWASYVKCVWDHISVIIITTNTYYLSVSLPVSACVMLLSSPLFLWSVWLPSVSCHRWRTWGLVRLGDFSKVTQPARSRSRIRLQACLTSEAGFLLTTVHSWGPDSCLGQTLDSSINILCVTSVSSSFLGWKWKWS